MKTVTTVGLNIAKSVFQVHGVGASGEVLIKRRAIPLMIERKGACLLRQLQAALITPHRSGQ